ncbi:MAG: VWA domain-containing protein [Treponema sp.]|nr:VWA domain-containing protein [Treponema sp.]
MGVKIEGVARKSMTLFFIIDTSSSMEGCSIAAVNDAMREVIPDIQDISDKNPDVRIKLAVMTFANGTKWQTPEPVPFSSYNWTDLSTCGSTEMGEAFKELNSKLDRKEFLADPAGIKAPVMIMISDGEPTDDYKAGLSVLQQNDWYKMGIKIALGVEGAVMNVLSDFTGSEKTAIYLRDKSQLKELIKIVSVASSKVGAKMVVETEEDAIAAAEDAVAEARDEMQNLDPESDEEVW